MLDKSVYFQNIVVCKEPFRVTQVSKRNLGLLIPNCSQIGLNTILKSYSMLKKQDFYFFFRFDRKFVPKLRNRNTLKSVIWSSFEPTLRKLIFKI